MTENRILDTSGLVTKTEYNLKITLIENKIPHTTDSIKKTDFDTKLTN